MKKVNFIVENGMFNNSVMGTNIAELAKIKKNAEELLHTIKRKGADETVICKQQEVCNAATKQYEDLVEAEKQAQENFGNSFVTFKVVNDETGAVNDVQKKIAFVKNNRPIDSKKVDKFIHIISTDKYEKAYPIIVIDAKYLIELGYIVYDMKGKELSLEEAENYFVILDGQHRGAAFAKLIAVGENYEIPNVHVRNVENVGGYLVDINGTGTSWSNKDRFVVAALTTKEYKELFTNIAALINEGFNPSTSSIIYTGKKLSKRLIDTALKGENVTLPKDANVNIQRGERFITLCKAANISVTFITKRYFIDGFNCHAESIGEEEAFKALEAMQNLQLTDEMLKDIKDEKHFIGLLKEAAKTI